MAPPTQDTVLNEALEKLKAGSIADSQERDQLLGIIMANPESLAARDIVWMAFRPDRVLREACGKLLANQVMEDFVFEVEPVGEAAV